jgi:thiol-disulfide isomerase/thioredoxin
MNSIGRLNNSTLTSSGGTSVSTSGGGGGFLSMLPSFSWKVVGIIICSIILAVIGYFIYKSVQDKSSSNNTQNNEGMTDGSSSGKEVEIMLFHTDWCPHCKTAKPEWDQVKTEFDGKQVNGRKVIFTDVNCTNESPDVERMMNAYKIEGYPTIKLIKDNQIIDFDAKPTKDTLKQFINTTA